MATTAVGVVRGALGSRVNTTIGFTNGLLPSVSGLNANNKHSMAFFSRSFSSPPRFSSSGSGGTSASVINSILNVLETMSQKKAKAKAAEQKRDDTKSTPPQDQEHGDFRTPSHTHHGRQNEELYQALTNYHKKPQLDDLKYWKIYPPEVRKWVFGSRQRQGYFDSEGKWLDFDARGIEKLVMEHDLMQGDSGDAFDPVTLPFKEYYTKIPANKKLRDTLPYDLEGSYRFGVTEEEAKDLPPKVKSILSFHYATQHEINVLRKQRLVERWGRRPYDTGSPEVVIACLSEKIKNVTNHLNNNRQDKVSLRTLTRYITERTQMMKYLKRTDAPKYYEVLKEIGLKDVVKINMFPMRNADLILEDTDQNVATSSKATTTKTSSKSKLSAKAKSRARPKLKLYN